VAQRFSAAFALAGLKPCATFRHALPSLLPSSFCLLPSAFLLLTSYF
jgi:hypothetical protein